MHTHAHFRSLCYAYAGIAGIEVPRRLMLVCVDVSVSAADSDADELKHVALRRHASVCVCAGGGA